VRVLAGQAALDPRDVPPDEARLFGRAIPDVLLTMSAGQVRLSDLTAERSVLLTFVFTRCAGVCSPFLMSWRSADRGASRSSEYTRVVLSFDPRDTHADMTELAHHMALGADTSWIFATAAPAEVRQLADATGFWWEWNERRQQFDHPAMIAGLRKGRLARLLVGGTVTSGRLDELVREVLGDFVPSYPLPGRVLFRCVRFDAATGRIAVDWGFALLLLPVASATLATTVLFALGGRSRKRGRAFDL
jgi:cytochrome oxidase Cu insertion factor (SCO1/SenC/PrrC family)